MANESDQLPKESHDRILREEILTQRNFIDATPQDRPKAIILAGQPGAGKGTLGGRAEIELGNNVVTVDPDALRDYHPSVDGFRRETPYTWSGRTHADASQWADELREADRKSVV